MRFAHGPPRYSRRAIGLSLSPTLFAYAVDGVLLYGFIKIATL